MVELTGVVLVSAYGMLTSLKAKAAGVELHFQPQWHLIPPAYFFGGIELLSHFQN